MVSSSISAIQEPVAYQATGFSAFSAIVGEGEKPDILEVALFDGSGAFTGGVARTGTFTISGVETSPEECGICVSLYGDVDPETGDPSQVLIAQSGSVEITSITGTFQGSLSNVSFKSLDLMTDAVTDDCEASLSSASLNAPIEALPEDGV